MCDRLDCDACMHATEEGQNLDSTLGGAGTWWGCAAAIEFSNDYLIAAEKDCSCQGQRCVHYVQLLLARFSMSTFGYLLTFGRDTIRVS
jgi:hypothetical protein